jgi:outer membrane protein OmpA-like peptidoglycan-associated protein
MRTIVIAALTGATLAACGGERIPPKDLVDARNEYNRAKTGVTNQLDPTDVHEAELALQKAESAWNDHPDEPETIDLAQIAQRKAAMAEAEAAAAKAQQDLEKTKSDLMAVLQGQVSNARDATQKTRDALSQKQNELDRKQNELSQTQQQLQASGAQLEEQKKKLADMEAKLKDARDTIAKIAAVKDDDRGMVITLSGEVLFKTGKWDLKAGAMAKLDQIADALRGKEQPMVVLGFTDNVGSRDNNMDLSQKRADSVRAYLVTKGIPADLISAQGKGPDNPVGDNNNTEGRTENRRVEIVVQPKK